MNKAVMISIAPKWWQMIKNGTKTLEFRNYGIPKGTKVYLRETKGKSYWLGVQSDTLINDKDYLDMVDIDINFMPHHYDGAFHLGTGLVVGEFIVGECIDIFNDLFPNLSGDANLTEWDNQGYTNQSHAHTITDLIVYDEEWQRNELGKRDISTLIPVSEDLEPEHCNKLRNAPTSPIHWNEFVSWNYAYDNYSYCLKKGYREGSFEQYINEIRDDKDYTLNKPNQGKIYVVEKEWNNEA